MSLSVNLKKKNKLTTNMEMNKNICAFVCRAEVQSRRSGRSPQSGPAYSALYCGFSSSPLSFLILQLNPA